MSDSLPAELLDALTNDIEIDYEYWRLDVFSFSEEGCGGLCGAASSDGRV